jgi:hypothetical protein
MFKQTISPPPELDYGSEEEVMIELRPGRTADEMAKLFHGANAAVPQQLSPGFYSGKVPVEMRKALGTIAAVHRKAIKRMH